MCDSGASEHFTFELSDYSSYEPFSSARLAKTADGTSQLLGQGTVIMNHKLSNGSSHLVKLYPVLYMPKLNIRLISNGMLCKQGLLATQDDLRIIFSYRDGAKQTYLEGYPSTPGTTLTFAYGTITHKNPSTVPPVSLGNSVNAKSIVTYDTWHKRLGHPSSDVFSKFEKHVKGFEKGALPKPNPHLRCIGCLKGKMKAQTYKESNKRATRPFELVHMDLKEYPSLSYNKYKYILVVVDDFSSYIWLGFLKHKSETITVFQRWYAKVFAENIQIKYIRSN